MSTLNDKIIVLKQVRLNFNWNSSKSGWHSTIESVILHLSNLSYDLSSIILKTMLERSCQPCYEKVFASCEGILMWSCGRHCIMRLCVMRTQDCIIAFSEFIHNIGSHYSGNTRTVYKKKNTTAIIGAIYQITRYYLKRNFVSTASF